MSIVPQNHIVVYPGYGFETRRGDYAIRIAGVVYEHREPIGIRKQFMVKMLARAMKATPAEADVEMFRRRVAPFVAKARPGQQVLLQIGPRRFRLRRRTRRNGWFRGRVRVSAQFVHELRGSNAMNGDRLTIRAWLSTEPRIVAESGVFILPETGLSIVSDIDDTIKESYVGNTRELLLNTFLREFKRIEGMAELYQQWAAQGAAFHYVSSSPWQLFHPIQQWSTDDGFPPGTLHLRTFRLRDQVIRRKANAKRLKSRSIVKMLKVFPRRRFVLIGDSGERDPEIYGKMLRKYRDRIVGVFIRDLKDFPLSPKRRKKLKQRAGPTPCETFAHSEELQQLSKRLLSR
jgi:hypothetical protein